MPAARKGGVKGSHDGGLHFRYCFTEPSNERTERSLRNSVAEGALFNADASIRSTYTIPFALQLNATNADIGLMASLQHLAATFSQIPGARISSWMGSRKRVWLFSTIFQKVFWVPVIFLPFLLVPDRVTALIILLAIGAFFTSIRTPAWSSLMGDIVPSKTWGRFFGFRNTIMSISSLAATLLAAQVLIYFGFPVLFALSMCLGLFAIFFFVKIHEPSFRGRYHYTHSLAVHPRLWPRAVRLNKNFASFTLFMTAVSFSVHLAAPFFTVYMLKDLGLSYGWFALLVFLESLAIMLSQPYWGKMCDRIGDRRVMFVTYILVCFVPLYWLFVRNPFHIIIANSLSGFAWAGFNIAAFNFLLAASPHNRRAEFTANHTFFTGLGLVFGSLAGGIMAQGLSSSSLGFMAGLQLIFLASFLCRLGCLVFLPALRETRVKETAEPMTEIFWRAVAVRPARGVLHAITAPSRVDYLKFIRCGWHYLRYRIRYKLRLWSSSKP